MTEVTIVEQLMDSKRFCQLFADAGRGFSKRALTQEDKRRLIEPVIELVLQTYDGPARTERPSRLTPEIQARAQAPKPIDSPIQIGAPEDLASLPFDPFKQPDAEPLLPIVPDKPFNAVDNRVRQFERLKEAVAAMRPHNPGETIVINMPPDWDASQAPVFFQALGTHKLVPGPLGGFGTRILPGGAGWEVTAQRIR